MSECILTKDLHRSFLNSIKKSLNYLLRQTDPLCKTLHHLFRGEETTAFYMRFSGIKKPLAMYMTAGFLQVYVILVH